MRSSYHVLDNAKIKVLQMPPHWLMPASHAIALRLATHHSSCLPSFRPAWLPSFRSYRSFLKHLHSQKFSFLAPRMFSNFISSVFLVKQLKQEFLTFPKIWLQALHGQNKTLSTQEFQKHNFNSLFSARLTVHSDKTVQSNKTEQDPRFPVYVLKCSVTWEQWNTQ